MVRRGMKRKVLGFAAGRGEYARDSGLDLSSEE